MPPEEIDADILKMNVQLSAPQMDASDVLNEAHSRRPLRLGVGRQ